MKLWTCERCGGKFNPQLDWHKCPPQLECITCKAKFFNFNKYRIRCDDCEEILSRFILGQKESKKRYDEGYRGGLRYT